MRRPKKEQYSMPSAHNVLMNPSVQWSCTHFGGISEIELYVTATGQWETVAVVNAAAGLDAEDIAGFIVEVISFNNNLGNRIIEYT